MSESPSAGKRKRRGAGAAAADAAASGDDVDTLTRSTRQSRSKKGGANVTAMSEEMEQAMEDVDGLTQDLAAANDKIAKLEREKTTAVERAKQAEKERVNLVSSITEAFAMVNQFRESIGQNIEDDMTGRWLSQLLDTLNNPEPKQPPPRARAQARPSAKAKRTKSEGGGGGKAKAAVKKEAGEGKAEKKVFHCAECDKTFAGAFGGVVDRSGAGGVCGSTAVPWGCAVGAVCGRAERGLGGVNWVQRKGGESSVVGRERAFVVYLV